MNAALSIEGLGAVDIDKLLTFVGVSSKAKKEKLSATASEAVDVVMALVRDMLGLAIEQRTKHDFILARNKILPNYVRMISALSDVVDIVVPQPVVQRIVHESFSELEAEYRDQGLSRFGTEVRDQAMFTVWTLRKINDLVESIAKAPPLPQELRKHDSECAGYFGGAAAWAQFHLECLNYAIRVDKAIYPEVLEEIQDGLRAIVNAYAAVRQGYDLRYPEQEVELKPIDWDEEDQELLTESMADVDRQLRCSDGN